MQGEEEGEGRAGANRTCCSLFVRAIVPDFFFGGAGFLSGFVGPLIHGT